jgi:hypothetical protein
MDRRDDRNDAPPGCLPNEIFWLFARIYDDPTKAPQTSEYTEARVKGLIYCILTSRRNYSIWKGKEGERMNCGVDCVDQDPRQYGAVISGSSSTIVQGPVHC